MSELAVASERKILIQAIFFEYVMVIIIIIPIRVVLEFSIFIIVFDVSREASRVPQGIRVDSVHHKNSYFLSNWSLLGLI